MQICPILQEAFSKSYSEQLTSAGKSFKVGECSSFINRCHPRLV